MDCISAEMLTASRTVAREWHHIDVVGTVRLGALGVGHCCGAAGAAGTTAGNLLLPIANLCPRPLQ